MGEYHPYHPTVTVDRYIKDLRDKLASIRKIAISNLEKSQVKMKRLYDKRVHIGTFSFGDKIDIPPNPW